MAAFQTTCPAGTTIRIDTGQTGPNTVDIEVAGIARQAQFIGPTYIDVQPLAADTLVGWNLGAVVSCAASPVQNVAPPTTIAAVPAQADALPFTGGHEAGAVQLGLPLLGLGLAICLVARWLRRRAVKRIMASPYMSLAPRPMTPAERRALDAMPTSGAHPI